MDRQIYIEVLMTDEYDCLNHIPTVDHKAMLLKDVIKKPKISWWHMYRLKKFLEKGYERINENIDQDKAYQESKAERNSDSGDSGAEVVAESQDNTGSPRQD